MQKTIFKCLIVVSTASATIASATTSYYSFTGYNAVQNGTSVLKFYYVPSSTYTPAGKTTGLDTIVLVKSGENYIDESLGLSNSVYSFPQTFYVPADSKTSNIKVFFDDDWNYIEVPFTQNMILMCGDNSAQQYSDYLKNNNITFWCAIPTKAVVNSVDDRMSSGNYYNIESTLANVTTFYTTIQHEEAGQNN